MHSIFVEVPSVWEILQMLGLAVYTHKAGSIYL
jgi:hypothetical protein